MIRLHIDRIVLLFDLFINNQSSIWQLQTNTVQFKYITHSRAQQLRSVYGGKISLIKQ